MTLWNRFRFWLRAVLFRARMEREMDAELRFHVEAFAEDLVTECHGQRRFDARAWSLAALNGAKQVCREARGVDFADALIQDLRFSVRLLRKSPGFTFAAILTLALGIGANTAIFGLVDSAFFLGLPFHDPERLVHIWTTEADKDVHTPTPNQYRAVQKESKSFQQVAAFFIAYPLF